MKTLLMITVIAALAAATISLAADRTGWNKHTDQVHRFTFEYPAGWTLKLPETDTRFFVTSPSENEADRFWENVNCIARKLDAPDLDLKAVEEAVLASLSKTRKDYALVMLDHPPWNQCPSLEVVYTFTAQTPSGDSFQVKILQRVAVVKGTLFTITFTSEQRSYDAFVDTARGVIESLAVE